MKRLLIRATTTLLLPALLNGRVGANAVGSASSAMVANKAFLPAVSRNYQPPEPCLPVYGEYEFLLAANATTDVYETFATRADLNGDGLDDILIARLQWQTHASFPLEILVNDGHGGVVLGTTSLISGTVPVLQHPSQVVIADFNGDTQSDIFVANSGYDDNPFPGYQNTLVLSTPDGRLVDASHRLPQQEDLSHSATAADIDSDGDIDLYVGNLWAKNEINPQILLNDGEGGFAVAENRLPPAVNLNQNGYTVCEFVDVNDDGSPDLVLGDAGDDIDLSHEYTTRTSEVLLNDGSGVFSWLPGALPPKDCSPYDKTNGIAAIYLNGDFAVDLLIVYQTHPDGISYTQALINNGDGTFRNETPRRMGLHDSPPWSGWITTSGVPRPVLELQDMDHDGDLDMWGKNWDTPHPEPLLMLNDGQGNFQHQPYSLGLKPSDLYFAFVDMEGDGGHDVLLTLNFPPDYVFVIRELGCRPGAAADLAHSTHH